MKKELLLLSFLIAQTVLAQTPSENKEALKEEMSMTSDYSLSLPVSRNGSGTGWQPDDSPVYAYVKDGEKWNFMVQGAVFMAYTSQNFNHNGKIGHNYQFDAPNWVMLMGDREIGKNGLLSLSAMFSFDRLTLGGNGYPVLFQSGETYEEKKLVDRQHPHDFFSEISIGYTQRLNPNADVYLVVGYPFEPALGPTAFVHRLSGINNPDSPIGHQWQDATHVSFGVATVGFRYKIAKIEGSLFTGREPDEDRYNFDKPRFDSYSIRLSVNPTKNWAFQVSGGKLKDLELPLLAGDVVRFTASAQYNKMFSEDSYLATTAVFGQNNREHHEAQNSFLLESNWQIHKTAFYTRYELVEKSAEELGLEESEFEGNLLKINELTIGVARTILNQWHTNLTLGVQGTAHFVNEELSHIYGSIPLSGQIYLRISPGKMKL